MARVHVVVEGQTEETFVDELLTPYMAERGVYLSVSLVTTKRTRAGDQFGGGITSYAKLRRDIVNVLGDSNLVCVTTMVDYYGLPDDFPGIRARHGAATNRASYLEDAFSADIGQTRFKPFLILHEFEALLFSDPSAIASAFPGTRIETELRAIRDAYPSPEAINDGRDTHPARRILNLLPGYRKRTSGTIIAKRIGLARIRSQCPRFDTWVAYLERLASS